MSNRNLAVLGIKTFRHEVVCPSDDKRNNLSCSYFLSSVLLSGALGIVITEYFNNKYDKYVFSKLVYKMISSEILNAIFNTDDNREKKNQIDLDNEDITDDYIVAVKNIQNVLESESLVDIMYDNVKIGDIEIVYNKNDFPEECNYAICFSTEKDKIGSGQICGQHVYIQFERITTDRSMKELIQIINDEIISIPEIKKKPVFAYKIPDHKIKLRKFKILNTALNKNVLPKYFCYAEKVDSVKYSEDWAGEILLLERDVSKHAEEAIHEKYNIKPNYTEEDLIKIIINVLDQIIAIDYAYIINHRNSFEDFYVTIKSISPNLARLCNSLLSYKLTIDQMIITIYRAMMCAIEIFCEYIEEKWIRNCTDNKKRIESLKETISVVDSIKYAGEINEKQQIIKQHFLFVNKYFPFDTLNPSLFFENSQLIMNWGKEFSSLKLFSRFEKFEINPYERLDSHLSYLYDLLNSR